jgi:hypothetical protein
MANTNQSIGFGADKTAAEKKPKKDLLYTHNFTSMIPGDVACSVERVLQQLGYEYEEVSTLKPTMQGVAEVPFVRHHAEDGTEIPLGTYKIVGFGRLTTTPIAGGLQMMLGAELVSKAAKERWEAFIKAVKEDLKTFSIFKGKALRVQSAEDLMVPKTLNLSKQYQAIYPQRVETMLNTCILWHLRNRTRAQELGLRTRRGAILEGHYGTGKSLFLYQAAQEAHQAGWTVVNVDPGMISVALMIMHLLTPVCITIEDVDATTHGDRDRLNLILNNISSVAAKCQGDYMILASTNFLERINPALLRPERIDAIISFELPDRDSIWRLLQLNLGDRLGADLEQDRIIDAIVGCTPAIISEIAQRAIVDAEIAGQFLVSQDALLHHITDMHRQRDMATPVLVEETTSDKLASSLYDVTQGNR